MTATVKKGEKIWHNAVDLLKRGGDVFFVFNVVMRLGVVVRHLVARGHLVAILRFIPHIKELASVKIHPALVCGLCFDITQ